MAAAQGVTITIKDELVSKPYVEMTIKLMHKFGVKVEADEGLTRLHIPGCQTYQSPGSVFVEGDASSASYFLAGATITGGTMRVRACPCVARICCLLVQLACMVQCAACQYMLTLLSCVSVFCVCS